jgi:hypothetical protein
MKQLKKVNAEHIETNVDPDSLPGVIELLKQEAKLIQNQNVLHFCKQNDLESLYEMRPKYSNLVNLFD